MRAERSFVAASLLFLAAPSVVGIDPTARAWCQMVSGNIRPTLDEPCVLAANHDGIHPLAWRRRCTSVSVSDALPPQSLTTAEVQDVLRASFLAWTTADCGGAPTGLSADVLLDANLCTEAAHDRSGPNTHAIVFVQEGWSSDRGHAANAYAVTYVWHDTETGEILDADLEINETTRRYAICPELGCTDGAVDLQNVLTHELGHYFGLAHTPDDVLATMNASAPPGETIKRTLATDDVTGICTVYAPGSLPDACDPTPRGGQNLACTPAGTCGCRAPGAADRGSVGLGLVALAALATVVRRRRR